MLRTQHRLWLTTLLHRSAGCSPQGWVSLGEDRDAIAAFLFTWRDGDFSRRPIKLPKASVHAAAEAELTGI